MGLSVQACQVGPHQTLPPRLCGPLFAHWCTVMLEEQGPAPNCSHKWICPKCLGTLQRLVPSTGTMGPSLAPEKQPHPITPPPPPPNFTLGTMQSDKYHSPGNRQTRLVHQKCESSLQRTHLHCSRVQPLNLTLCIALGIAWMQLLDHGHPSMNLSVCLS